MASGGTGDAAVGVRNVCGECGTKCLCVGNGPPRGTIHARKVKHTGSRNQSGVAPSIVHQDQGEWIDEGSDLPPSSNGQQPGLSSTLVRLASLVPAYGPVS